MWYEILPCFGILCVGITVPQVFAYFGMKFVQNGNPYRRDIRANPTDRGLLHRDLDLFKNPYVMQGLDNIPDSD